MLHLAPHCSHLPLCVLQALPDAHLDAHIDAHLSAHLVSLPANNRITKAHTGHAKAVENMPQHAHHGCSFAFMFMKSTLLMSCVYFNETL